MAAWNDYGCLISVICLCSRCGWLEGKMSIGPTTVFNRDLYAV